MWSQSMLGMLMSSSRPVLVANSTSDAFLPDFWMFRFFENPENRNTGNPDFPELQKSDFRKSGFPGIRKSGFSDSRTSESPKIRIFGNLKIPIFGFPGHMHIVTYLEKTLSQ